MIRLRSAFLANNTSGLISRSQVNQFEGYRSPWLLFPTRPVLIRLRPQAPMAIPPSAPRLATSPLRSTQPWVVWVPIITTSSFRSRLFRVLAMPQTTVLGNLVDANLANASAQLTALQTQQQLATQALSIANSQPSNILSLFKGA